jgi:hypothetical protein
MASATKLNLLLSQDTACDYDQVGAFFAHPSGQPLTPEEFIAKFGDVPEHGPITKLLIAICVVCKDGLIRRR